MGGPDLPADAFACGAGGAGDPVHDTLKLNGLRHRADDTSVLVVASREHVVIIATVAGAGHTVDGFSGNLRHAISEVGLPLRCKPHLLRKAAGRRLAEAGCSANEIMSVLGHKTLAEAERHTRDADPSRLARAAVTRLEAHGADTVSQTLSGKFGENPKK